MNSYTLIHEGDFLSIFGDYNNCLDIKQNIGDTWEDYIQGKYIFLNEEQIKYLNDNPSSSPKEAFFMEESDEIKDLDKDHLIERIYEYDGSNNVNTFYVNGDPAWFSNSKRISLRNKIIVEQECGQEDTTLWINNVAYVLGIDEARQMLTDIEVYAMACYNNTQNNISEVRALTSKSELKAFDITKGYPEKLSFNL